MESIHGKLALLPVGWARDVRIEMEEGRIASVTAGAPPEPGDDRCDVVVAGMPNLHSHAFQRGMAGLAEVRGTTADTFWTWREVMYRFALSMTPEQLEAVAGQLYVEMLEAGFTRVGEFHYLHHDHDGRPYGNIAEMAERIAAASDRAGIRLTLMPVFYAHANFGGEPPTEGQRRFICDVETFGRLYEASAEAIVGLDGALLGVAPHSLRAVTPDELAAVCELTGSGPIHIHVAEQVREVEDSLAWSGQRPVDWLFDHAPVNERWCLIHATHMTESETARLAGTGAVAGLCPVTEANLGDGTFPATTFLGNQGRFGIGTDSNVRISVADELRQLEYAQRLQLRQRNVLATTSPSTGRSLFDGAWRGGQQALGGSGNGIVAAAPADLVSLKNELWEGVEGDGMLDAWIFAAGVQVDGVWVGGEKVVAQGRHRQREVIADAYRAAMRQLLATG